MFIIPTADFLVVELNVNQQEHEFDEEHKQLSSLNTCMYSL